MSRSSVAQASPATGTPPVSGAKIYCRLLLWIRPYWGTFLVSLMGFLMFSSAQPMLAGMLKYFVDGLVNPGLPLFPHASYAWLARLNLLYAVPLLILLIAIWQGIGGFFGNFFLAKVSLGLVHDLRRALFDHMMRLPTAYFDRHNSGILLSRITYNVTMVTGAATDAIKIVIREGLTIIFLFTYLIWMNWKLTLVMLVTLPFITLVVVYASRHFRRYSHKIQDTMGELSHVTSETLQSHRVVRGFGGETLEQMRFARASDNNRARQLKMSRVNAIYTPTLQLLIYAAMAILMFLVLLLRGEASAGELVAYITAAGLLPKPIRQLSEVSSTIQRGIAGAASIFETLDEAPEADDGTREASCVKGRLEVRNLDFTYPGSESPVLQGVNFIIEPGQMVALVGRSGSGKSTLASLIPRFYTHDKGDILLDDIPIQEFTLAGLRHHISLVTQQVNLFNDTVLKNIAYGELAGKPFSEVRKAAEDAYALEFIEQLPAGFATEIGENGVMLSGGQRQRLSIARALLKNAPVLILDEATSALDTESERHIQAALERATLGRTTLVIAHRLSTIERADLVLVMEAGAIVERGTHAELLAANGVYTLLHARQFQEEGKATSLAKPGSTPAGN
jgi:subfamily B ATP-binding cassette protein MsbA